MPTFNRTNHFGYLPRLRSLSLEGCKIRRLPALAFSGLSGLRSLSVRTRNDEWPDVVMEVDPDALTGLSELRRLNLTSNNLWGLPEAAFCHLGRLRALNLSRNHLQDPRELGFSRESRRACRIPLRDGVIT